MWIEGTYAKTVPKLKCTGKSIKLGFDTLFGILCKSYREFMKYLQFKFSAIGEDGRSYERTMFYEQPTAPDEAQAIANAGRNNPGFTDIRVASVTIITAEEYAFRVRIMCDSDTWGFQPIS